MEMNISEAALHELEVELQTEAVPGTEIMKDVGTQHFARSKRSHIVLVPQPSADIHDPLNWSPIWKLSAIASVTLVTFAQTLGPLAIAPIFPQLIADFHSDLAGVVQFTGVTILVLGFSNFIWVPLSITFGRRFVLLLSTVISIGSMIWRAEARSYSSFMGAAILAGIGTGPGEAIQPAIIADVIFLHERGFYNTLYFAFFFAAVMLGPIIAGTMAEGVGWRSFWWLNTALNVLALLVLLVCLPETKWDRPRPALQPEKPQTAHPPRKVPAILQESKSSDKMGSELPSGANSLGLENAIDGSNFGRGRPSRAQWRIIQPTERPLQSFISAFYLPWKLFFFPIVQFASFVVGFSSSCYLMITFVQSQVLSVPPYNFNVQSVGFANFASLVGAFLGLLTAGPLSDWISIKLTQRNNGVREPEMRLLTMVPYVLVMLLGNFIVGFGFQYHWNWRAIVIVGFGCAGLQIAALPAIASTYAVDSFKPAAGSLFVSITINKNVWGYGVSKFITPWAIKSGFVPPFMLNMCLTFLWCSCGVIFWFYGKRLRKWTAKSSVHRS